MGSDIQAGTRLLGLAESDIIRIAAVAGLEEQSKAPASTAAPGSVVIVRDEEYVVTSLESATDGYFVNVVGPSQLVHDTEATFSTGIETIIEADPTKVSVVADDSPHHFPGLSGWQGLPE